MAGADLSTYIYVDSLNYLVWVLRQRKLEQVAQGQ